MTCHDGFTLFDLVSYNHKHNEANLEGNRDGTDNNLSWNCGVEGITQDERVNALRIRQQKNLLASLFLSQGIPMIAAGDEFGRSQQGNNNAYCQDNEISWVDWTLLAKHGELRAFVQKLIAFRKAHPSLRRTRFFKGMQEHQPEADILWLGKDGEAPEWEEDLAVACLVNGKKEFTGAAQDDDHLLMVFNADSKNTSFVVPPAPGRAWTLAFTTHDREPAWLKRRSLLTAPPRSVTVFVSSP